MTLHARIVLALMAALILACMTPRQAAERSRREAVPVQRPSLFNDQAARQRLALLEAEGSPDRPRIAALLDSVMGRQDEMWGWVLPLFRSYLPVGAELDAHVYFAVGLPEAVQAQPSGLFVDIGSPTWGQAGGIVWGAILRGLYRRAYEAARPEVEAGDGFATVLARIQADGILDYVASQGDAASSPWQVFRVTSNREAAADRFEQVDKLVVAIRRGTAEERRAQLEAMNELKDGMSAYSIVGAMMAESIEQKLGRDALVETNAKARREITAKGAKVAKIYFKGDTPLGCPLK